MAAHGCRVGMYLMAASRTPTATTIMPPRRIVISRRSSSVSRRTRAISAFNSTLSEATSALTAAICASKRGRGHGEIRLGRQVGAGHRFGQRFGHVTRLLRREAGAFKPAGGLQRVKRDCGHKTKIRRRRTGVDGRSSLTRSPSLTLSRKQATELAGRRLTGSESPNS